MELTKAELEVFSTASRFVHGRFEKWGRDKTRLPVEFPTFLIVESAQGIIDNGGLQYFFESDWDDKPPYQEFCDAYARIEAREAAKWLAEAVELFPFADPHLHQERRNEALERLWESEAGKLADLDNKLCGCELVWRKLFEYVLRHGAMFEVGKERRN